MQSLLCARVASGSEVSCPAHNLILMIWEVVPVLSRPFEVAAVVALLLLKISRISVLSAVGYVFGFFAATLTDEMHRTYIRSM